MLALLNCFYGGRMPTKAELMQQTGLKDRALSYYITRLKRWKILYTHRRRYIQATYSIEPKMFHARIDTLLCDPLKNLSAPQVRQPATPREVALTAFDSIGRCHACDRVLKTNDANLCRACFENGGPVTVEHKLISTPLRHNVRNKAEGKCEKCGKRLFRRLKDAFNQQYYDKVTREIAHIWRRDGNLHNIGLDNLELLCDACYNERKTAH